MSSTSAVIPVPTVEGAAGAWVDVSAIDAIARSFIFVGVDGDTVQIEVSNDGAHSSVLHTMPGSSAGQEWTTTSHALSVRARRLAGTSPAFLTMAGGTSVAGLLYVQQLFTNTLSFPLPNVQFHQAVLAQTIVRMRIAPVVPQAMSDVNWNLIEVVISDGAGGPETIAGSVTTKLTGGTGSWALNTDITIPVVASAIPSGSRVYMRISVAGGAGLTPLPFVLYLVLSQP